MWTDSSTNTICEELDKVQTDHSKVSKAGEGLLAKRLSEAVESMIIMCLWLHDCFYLEDQVTE